MASEARKISLNNKEATLQRKTIQENIVQRFVNQVDTELTPEKIKQIQELTQTILKKMGFQLR